MRAVLLIAALAACSDRVEGRAPSEDEGQAVSARREADVTLAKAQFAEGVRVTEVALYQGTRVSLLLGGEAPTRAMPVVAGRDALVRAYVAPDAARIGTSVRGELYLVREGKTQRVFEETLLLAGPSREDTPATTLNFDVPGAELTPETRFLVRLVDAAAPARPGATKTAAQAPPSGVPEPLRAERGAEKLRVVIVPVQYGADGSNRLPDTSASIVDAIRKRLLEFYPVPEVVVTVREPVPFSVPISGTGPGWDEVLMTVTRARLTDRVAPDVYYYGAFAPAATLTGFCTGSCVLGLSGFAESPADTAHRVSVGVLFPTSESIDTVPHELGHGHGRDHAPCGRAGGVDAHYPYPGGLTGTWGYSVVTKTLQPPSLFDQMSYCNPAWQSDYTYRGLFERLSAVARIPASAAPLTTGPGAARFRMLHVSDGALAWYGEPFVTDAVLDGAKVPVEWLDDGGRVSAVRTAHAVRFTERSSGYLLVPYDGDEAFARLRVARGIELAPAAMAWLLNADAKAREISVR